VANRAFWFLALVASLAPVMAGSANAFEFRLDAGAASLDSRATGIFDLGELRSGQRSARVRALVHHGRVLQVHGRLEGRWLAKTSGSSGGKPMSPSKFDELVAIAGGVNRDVRQASADVRRSFSTAAELMPIARTSAARVNGVASEDWFVLGISPVSTASAADCGALGCEALYQHESHHSEGFRIAVDASSGHWGFQGFGIVAIWALPGS
jgi:hypothetical protein